MPVSARRPAAAASQYPPGRWRAATEPGRPRPTARSRRSVGPDDERIFTDSGIEIDRLYDEGDVAPGLEERLGEPGAPPFTRGIHEGMYRDRLWTMRQYAGFASPEDTNERYRYLIEHGSTGLSMAFDLPTQLGRDSDDPLCHGEVGRTGVPIDTIEDMRICFDQIPLDGVSTSMTINAPAAILLLLYELVGEEQGVPSEKLRGTVQNDVLKEYMARGNYIYPPEPTMRLTTDIFEYCHENVPKWNTISISGYHIREKGCSAVQEVAFTLSNAIAYVEAALERGLKIDEFAPRLAFFFNGHNNVFQEIAKFRAVRRMWAKIVKERFGAENPKSMQIRFHTQTGGVTLQAQQPEVNIIRVALQGFAAVCGGTQSLHTNGFDEALALPTERSARIALRTQQVLAYESGVADTVDPFAGSYFVESLTDEIEAARLGADGEGRGAGRLGRGAGVHAARDRGVGALATTSATRAARTSSSASTNTSPTRSTTSTSSGSTPRPSSASWRASRPSRRTATRPRSRPSSSRSATSPAATATSCTRSAPRSPPTPRSARSAARCATSSANTRAAPSSKRQRVIRIARSCTPYNGVDHLVRTGRNPAWLG